VVPPSEREPQDLRAARETEAAAQEAGGVGGRAPADDDPARRPRRDAFTGEKETDITAPAYGDADHERSTERTGET
jgi:hypothetical protein